MSGHTPGPWQLRYALLHPEEIRAVGDSEGSFVADCYTTSRSLEEIAANARLIAAAPALLAACEAFDAAERLTDPGAYLRALDALKEQMRAAIAKARAG